MAKKHRLTLEFPSEDYLRIERLPKKMGLTSKTAVLSRAVRLLEKLHDLEGDLIHEKAGERTRIILI